MPTCPTCAPSTCTDCEDLYGDYSLVGQAYLNNVEGFGPDCPQGFICGPVGPTPNEPPWNPPPPPPECPGGNCGNGGGGTTLTLEGCSGPITRRIPAGISDEDYQVILLAMLEERHQQQIICDGGGGGGGGPPATAPMLTNSPPNVCSEEAYNFTFTVSGGTGIMTFTLVSGSLPGTIVLDSALGTLTGDSGDVTGGYSFSIKVQDAHGLSTTTPFSFNVSEITTESLLPFTVGVAYVDTLAQTGMAVPVEWIILDGDLPDGLSLDPDTGEISGTPTNSDTQEVTFGVEGDDGQICVKDLTLSPNVWINASTFLEYIGFYRVGFNPPPTGYFWDNEIPGSSVVENVPLTNVTMSSSSIVAHFTGFVSLPNGTHHSPYSRLYCYKIFGPYSVRKHISIAGTGAVQISGSGGGFTSYLHAGASFQKPVGTPVYSQIYGGNLISGSFSDSGPMAYGVDVEIGESVAVVFDCYMTSLTSGVIQTLSADTTLTVTVVDA